MYRRFLLFFRLLNKAVLNSGLNAVNHSLKFDKVFDKKFT